MNTNKNEARIVIKTTDLCKYYKLYRNPKDRLKEAIHPKRKKFHKEFYALNRLNISIKRGEVIGIVGKNGSGKSTLLKLLSRVLTPSFGTLFVEGKVSSLLELGSGFNPELTGIENIYFYGTILGFTRETVDSKLQEILEFAEIGDFVYQPLKTYSSGMKARLAFSVAINVDPDILILDEVLAVGDQLFRRKCYARMENFFKGEKTILFVSHSASDINQFCTRAVLLDEGELLIEGPPKLVTGLYEKLLFSKPEDTKNLKDEIRKIEKDGVRKTIAYSEIIKAKELKSDDAESKEAYQNSNVESSDNESGLPNAHGKAYYLPGLEPKSKIEYKNFDVDIQDIQIRTLSGQKVNVLVSGDKYVYSYIVDFKIRAKDVLFGMQIKSEKGLILNGLSSNAFDIKIKSVTADSKYLVKFFFKCNLLYGNYYTNAGVTGIVYEKNDYLNRVVDVLMFRVQKSNSVNPFGIVSLDNSFSIESIC
jgi:lipopolysaccharide transport system ATP-binding protein